MNKLQEKMLKGEESSLSNEELLSVILQYGSKNDSTKLAESTLSYYGESGLSKAGAKELSTIKGISKAKACSIAASIELAKRLDMPHTPTKIEDSSDVFNLISPKYKGEKREICYALLLNIKGDVESIETISIGELSATNVHPREVYSPAIRKGAAGIIITHNHPSGDPEPSNDDIVATRRLLEAGKIIGIKFIDHVICANERYVSLKAEGIIS